MAYFREATSTSPPFGEGPRPTFVGLGNALRLRFDSDVPFDEAAAAIQRVEVRSEAGLLRYLRFFGGGSFDPRRAHDENCWSEFGHATFLLPRFTYLDFGGRAVLLLVAPMSEEEPPLEEATTILSRGEQLGTFSSDAPRPSIRATLLKNSADEAVWRDLLRGALDQIQSGTLSKVVAARRVTVQLSERPTMTAVIDQLDRQAPDCTVFGLRIGSRLFVGATPETLIRKNELQLDTEALAGTLARREGSSDAQLATQLLGSEKDRREHQFVVDAVRSALLPICRSVVVPPSPQVRHLRRMVHLRTPISAELSSPHHVLSLVSRLHPTPAVGGVPRLEAVDFIFERENVDRGWYAAPFGWCDTLGNGHFVVALRSALIAGDKVHVYAGAGIVADSDPNSEYEETELKMGSILGALGLSS